MYRGFGLWLRQLWQAIEHVHRFVLPTPLLAGRGIDLIHGSPKPHGTVPNGQLGRIHLSTFEAKQNLAPTLGGLAHPVLDCLKAFLATGCYPNNHKGAELVSLAPKAAVDTISPDVDDWLIVQFRFSPAVVFCGPIALKPRTVFAENPATEGPRRTLRAGAISPLEIPLR